MKRDELLSSQHGHTAGYVARIEMSLIDNMVAAIHGFQESPGQPSSVYAPNPFSLAS